jgi:hypothetical protein
VEEAATAARSSSRIEADTIAAANLSRITCTVIVHAARASSDRGVAGAFPPCRPLRDGLALASRHVKHVPIARASYEAGYLAGREAAFEGYDGGWSYATPYVVTLARGGGVTYRIATRLPMARGLAYSACGRAVCTRRAR